MNEAFEIEGHWWLPETPQNKVSGTLSYSPGNGSTLILLGELKNSDDKSHYSYDFKYFDIINGISANGEPITANSCFLNKAEHSIGNAGNFIKTIFRVDYLFIGVRFSSKREIQFSSLSIRLHNLENWYDKEIIQVTLFKSSEDIITFKYPDPIDNQIFGYHVQIGVSANRDIKINSVSLSSVVFLTLSNDSRKSFFDYLSLLRLFQDYFTFAITEPTYITELVGQIEENFISTKNYSSPNIVKIFIAAPGWQSEANEVISPYMLLPLSETESILPSLLQTWIEKSEILRPVYDLFFAGIYRSIYSDNEFLNLTQALETYHRRKYGGQYIPEDIFLNGLYKILVAALPQDISDDFRSSLKNGKLRYAHEYSLRKRVYLLSKHVSENISLDFLKNEKMCSSFAEKIADTRNYLTHYSPELKDKALTSGSELFELNQQLSIIIKICLLEELGIPFEKIVSFLKRDRYFRNFIN